MFQPSVEGDAGFRWPIHRIYVPISKAKAQRCPATAMIAKYGNEPLLIIKNHC